MTVYDANCDFCQYGQGDDPTAGKRALWANEGAVGFWSIAPRAATHALIVPRHHYVDWRNVDNPQAAFDVWRATTDLAEALGLQHFRVRSHVGWGGGQRVFHLHLHLVSSSPPANDPDELKDRAIELNERYGNAARQETT